MKNKLIKALSFFIFLFSASLASAQIYVKMRPVVPVIVVTHQPSPTHVWIDEDWQEDGDGYRYSGGYWGMPPHPGYRWKQGYWKQHSNGHRWHHGGWRK